ncbi:hypothetical protein KL86DYS2_12102 [uncultured Dysgonomonas sp.]|uniref:Uncharacterized protein n=1 Tax=uncultured Dysgonomonas sp. TaxID=206096 RepID=A0A212JQX1_9BACT|nr:hypothetical protein KL86DYS2_12102 [uncultured Dysgonomonas sp.]
MLKHGNRPKSLFKYGLEYIAAILLNPYRIQNIKVEHFFVITQDSKVVLSVGEE